MKLEQNTRYSRYQDYVIKNRKFVGEFEQMYRDFDDPWEQSTREEWASEKAVALNLIQKTDAKKIIELGRGLSHYTSRIHNLGVDVLGIDVSGTAIRKAKASYPEVPFHCGRHSGLLCLQEVSTRCRRHGRNYLVCSG